jgi:hypothetical protein
MLIVNALGIANYVPVVVWDVFTILTFYFVVPVPLRFQIPPALLLTGDSVVLWLIYRLPLAGAYETVAVLAAYVFANVYGIFVSRRLELSRRQQFVLLMQETKTREELETALAEVKTLRGIIPICASCKNIRDDKGYWHRVEAYITEHSEVGFTHGICPVCAERNFTPGCLTMTRDRRTLSLRQGASNEQGARNLQRAGMARIWRLCPV